VRNPEVARDLTSEVFVDALRAISRDPEKSVTVGWLYTVAHRRVVDHWRFATRHRTAVERLVGLDTTKSFGPAQATAEMVDLEAFRQIPDRQRHALVLRYVVGLPVDEVARRLETSYSVAESLLARGRRTARAALVGTNTALEALAS